LSNKIIIFELKRLKYICQINNVDIDDQLISVSEFSDENKRIINLGYISTNYKNKNAVNLISYFIDNNYEVTHCRKN
jgi:hypothetical protein